MDDARKLASVCLAVLVSTPGHPYLASDGLAETERPQDPLEDDTPSDVLKDPAHNFLPVGSRPCNNPRDGACAIAPNESPQPRDESKKDRPHT